VWHRHTIPYEHTFSRVPFGNLFAKPKEKHLMAKMNTAGLIHAASCTIKQDYKALFVALEQTNPHHLYFRLLSYLLSSSEYLLCPVFSPDVCVSRLHQNLHVLLDSQHFLLCLHNYYIQTIVITNYLC